MNMREKVSRSVVSELVQASSVLITSASVIFEYHLVIEAERFPLIRLTRITFPHTAYTPEQGLSDDRELFSGTWAVSWLQASAFTTLLPLKKILLVSNFYRLEFRVEVSERAPFPNSEWWLSLQFVELRSMFASPSCLWEKQVAKLSRQMLGNEGAAEYVSRTFQSVAPAGGRLFCQWFQRATWRVDLGTNLDPAKP